MINQKNTDAYSVAHEMFLSSSGISEKEVGRFLERTMTSGIDSADIYFQAAYHESWFLEDSIIKEGSFDIDRGVGVRAISGDKTGFSYSDEIHPEAIIKAADAARSIVKQGITGTVKTFAPTKAAQLYTHIDPLSSLSEDEKIVLLRTVDTIARREDHRVTEVMASLSGLYEVIFVFNSNGVMGADVRPLIRFDVTVIVNEKGKRERGHSGGGGRYGYDYFIENKNAEKFAKEAVRQALVNLNAVPAPAGPMPVVLGPGWPGVLLHEAIGHGLEGDFNRKGSSTFSGKLGERVASSLCTIVDDGTLPNRRGSLTIDDEGTPTQCTVLIEKGILKGYMHDTLNARLMKMSPTGNGRRESYADIPIPRMTNTYLLPGEQSPEEIIASVDKGLYAVNFGGGQVDITSGKFVFSASEAYLIEKGKLTQPVKGATLIGNGPEVLTKVSMVGNDLQLDEGVGTCGKDGQSVPVGVGQPTLRVDELTVGGTK